MADKAYFLSDLHLGSSEEPNAYVLQNFLRTIISKDNASHLFLLGDVFDMWISNHLYFKKKFAPVIAELVRIKGLGVSIHYFEGNHDLYLNDYFGKELGFKIHDRAAYFSLFGHTLRVEHGDQMDPSDVWYLRLRWFWHTPVLKWLAPRVSGNFLGWFGENFSRISRLFISGHKQKKQDRTARITRIMHDHVARVWEHKPFDIFIAGHVHMRYLGDAYVGQGVDRMLRHVVNLGSWFEKPCVFQLTADGGQFIDLK